MTQMNIWKNITQIKSETVQVRYYRAFDFARAVALVEFLSWLESKYGEKFRIVTAHPILVVNRDTDLQEKVFTFDLWVRFVLDETEYYIQMDKNPFLPAYFNKSFRLSDKIIRHEYSNDMSDVIYKNTDWNAEPKTIRQLTKNLKDAFIVVRNRKGCTYKQDIPVYDRERKQTIYTN